MKKIILVMVLVLGFNSCAIYDYGMATVEFIDIIAEGTGETYIETITGEEFDEDKIIDSEDEEVTEEE